MEYVFPVHFIYVIVKGHRVRYNLKTIFNTAVMLAVNIFIITIGDKCTGCTYGVWAATEKYAREYNCNYQKELIPYMHKISAVLQAEYSSANK